jgi:hypothetical protein
MLASIGVSSSARDVATRDAVSAVCGITIAPPRLPGDGDKPSGATLIYRTSPLVENVTHTVSRAQSVHVSNKS